MRLGIDSIVRASAPLATGWLQSLDPCYLEVQSILDGHGQITATVRSLPAIFDQRQANGVGILLRPGARRLYEAGRAITLS
jgi:hypothetical protein